MDSLTQIVLGAAVAEATIGRQVGRRAALAGAALGTLPDLDVFVPLGGVVEDFVFHRSASHSLFTLTLISPLLAWLLWRWSCVSGRRAGASAGSGGLAQASYKHWLLAVWLVLVTHPLLDVFTIYGTQLLWPLTDYPFGAGSVFIIDPAFTLPLVAGLLAALILDRNERIGRRLNYAGMMFGLGYLGFGLFAQAHVQSFARASLQQQNLDYENLVVLAAPFTSLAWRIVAVGTDAYYVGYHSLLAPAEQLRVSRFARQPELLDELDGDVSVRRLRRFTKGLFTVEGRAEDVRISDLRMGLEPDRYAFTFVVGMREAGKISPVRARRVQPVRFRDGDWSRLIAVLRGAANFESMRSRNIDCLLARANERKAAPQVTVAQRADHGLVESKCS